MAAEEFSNGENLGSVRQKLNNNAKEINKKVTEVSGKGLSTNDFTDAYKEKVDAVPTTIANANTNSNITAYRIGVYTAEDLPTNLPDDLISIVTE